MSKPRHAPPRGGPFALHPGGCKVFAARSPTALTHGVAAMVKNIVAGCVLAALVFMGLLAYGQKHHECLNGHLVETLEQGHLIKERGHLFKPCGSVSDVP
jgi:hypothetical protein